MVTKSKCRLNFDFEFEVESFVHFSGLQEETEGSPFGNMKKTPRAKNLNMCKRNSVHPRKIDFINPNALIPKQGRRFI